MIWLNPWRIQPFNSCSLNTYDEEIPFKVWDKLDQIRTLVPWMLKYKNDVTIYQTS